jgi:hypothetical protein
MLAQNSDKQQQQNSTNKSNQLFLKENSNNKETTTVSFTKSINDIHIEVLKRKINSINHTYQNYFMKFLSRIQKMQNYYMSI